MPDERIRPQGSLKPMNKLLIAMLRLGAGMAGRLPVFRVDPIT
jgi:hypothetical protein